MNLEEVIKLPDEVGYDKIKEIIRNSVHHSRDVERMNAKGQYIIKKLFEAYATHPQQLPDGQIIHFMIDVGECDNVDCAKKDGIGILRSKFDKKMKNPLCIERILLMRRICDHIASMTDRYAIEEYNNLYG